jgi:tRNA threonylcarbamoyl adenosine modification protein YeaZ
VLVIDTATTRAVVALGDADGAVRAERSWTAGYRHGEELLAHIEGLLAAEGTGLEAIGAIVVGTGPGAFTGLRVGIATGKGLAHARRVPIVGIGTALALLAAAGGGDRVVLQPAGPSDRVMTRNGEPPRLIPGGVAPELRAGETVVAVDLDGREGDEAVAAGEAAVRGLGAALLAAGAARLAAGDADDIATLVPEYVTLPRGVRTEATDAKIAFEGVRDPAGSPR